MYYSKTGKEKAGTDALVWWLDWALASRFAAVGMHGGAAAA